MPLKCICSEFTFLKFKYEVSCFAISKAEIEYIWIFLMVTNSDPKIQVEIIHIATAGLPGTGEAIDPWMQSNVLLAYQSRAGQSRDEQRVNNGAPVSRPVFNLNFLDLRIGPIEFEPPESILFYI